MHAPRLTAVSAFALGAILALTSCSSGAAPEENSSEQVQGDAITVIDNDGEKVINLPLRSVVATDNRTFELLDSWGVELTAGAVSLMPASLSYTSDDAIVDLGTHREPDLEALVAVDPDLVIVGQRYASFQGDIETLVPGAVVLNFDPKEGEAFDAALKRQVLGLGEVFGKQEEATQIVADFDEAVDRVKAAYDPSDTVMAVNTSGGTIGYLAPTLGRSLGPVFDILALTPALEVEGASEDHTGDEISVEAIADANPDWILVLDRDAVFAADDPSILPGAEIIEASEPLQAVTAVSKGQVVYMPNDTYLNEGIVTYTEFLNDFANALEAAKKS